MDRKYCHETFIYVFLLGSENDCLAIEQHNISSSLEQGTLLYEKDQPQDT